MPIGPSAAERFWGNVRKTPECWEWLAYKTPLGYGITQVSRKNYRAHRLAYELVYGPIPVGMVIDHTCHNRACVKPSHLRMATQKQNTENRSGATRYSKTGVRGVRATDSGKWRGEVTHRQRTHNAGTYETVAEAEAACVALRNRLFTHNDLDRPRATRQARLLVD